MNSAINAYKQNHVQTAPPEKLVLMLYDGAIRFINQAVKAIDENDIQTANNSFHRAQDVMLALISGINHDAGEIADNLQSLYDYMHHRLIQANVKKDKKIAQEVLEMVKDLRETWVKMLKESKGKGVNASGSITATG